MLKKLKYAEPKSLAVEPGKSTNQSLAAIPHACKSKSSKAMLPEDSDELKRGPMANAFVITNPLLPNEYFVPKGIDKFVRGHEQGRAAQPARLPEAITRSKWPRSPATP